MTDFDTRLDGRMRRLEAAIPTVRTPARRSSMPGGLLRTTRVRVALAVAVLLVAASAVAAERILYPDIPEPVLEWIVEGVFNDDGCPSLDAVRPQLRDAMDGAGYADWTIELREGSVEAPCVAAAIVPPLHAVLLFRHGGPEMSAAIEQLSEHLRTNCLNRAEAIQLATSVMRTLGYQDFEVRADPWGPEAVPLDKPGGPEAYIEHAQHCFVYSGHGEMDGRPVIYLWGPWL